jgi:K+-transporting ATPase ATPase A chain
MTFSGWAQVALFFALVLAVTRPLGAYMYRVLEGTPPLPRVLGACERAIYRLCGVNEKEDQSWRRYAGSLLAFSAFSVLFVYVLHRVQAGLPFNPRGFGAVEPWLAFNTAASFTTNTNWQSYSGESTLSYFVQMAGLTTQNFASAAAGIGVALALARGFTRHGQQGLGNFWVDLVRGTLYVFLPICLIYALFLVSQGAIQNLSPYLDVVGIGGFKQTIAMGPVASQEAVKMLGTNGGGFFNANSAHPFENPTPLTNLIQMLSIFAIPAGLTYTYGRMAKNQKQGWAIFSAMAFLWFAGVVVAYWAEAQDNAALRGLAVTQGAGNLEGKETRFGVAGSALFAVVTTDASCGAVNAMHDSFTPIAGLVPMLNIQLGEVVFGGTGAGLYGMLVMVLLAVFIAGLMVGRTPEYLGKKVEAKEVQLAMLYALIFPTIILGFTAIAAASDAGLASLTNSGPHGLSEILYAFSSGAGNNGSAFAGLDANTPFYNLALAFTMLMGRFLMIVPALAIAGSMAPKRIVPPGPGTFPTDGALFSFLLVSVIVILGALTFFPAITLGPVVEHFLQGSP